MLHRSSEARFNVFDVMHHGTHEKQLSNVFRWLLETEGSHHLADTFLRIFIEEVNRGLVGREPFAATEYLVMQEVNTSEAGEEGPDIADLVLKNDDAVIVVENYFTSDGHGHSYERYLRYSQRGGRQGAVVLLCHDQDSSLQRMGWQNASVVTCGRLVDRLRDAVESDREYQGKHPEPYSFIDQMHRKFVKGRSRVEDHQVLDFVVAMCATSEAGRYGEQRHSSAAERFANDVAEQARARFGEGRELLGRVKGRLRNFSDEVLKGQLNATLGDGFVSKVSAGFRGSYEWTVNFHVPGVDLPPVAEFGEHPLQLKFGPSAWFANERHSHWHLKVDPKSADYSRLFITSVKTREVRQSVVTLQEVLDGLSAEDLRLHDEIVKLLIDSN
ncbi:MAG: PD-(D/E)XK nuclease family protein [Candidatus Nanopelagicales bacterium]